MMRLMTYATLASVFAAAAATGWAREAPSLPEIRGDGVTINTDAINQALLKSRHVALPPGVFLVDDTIEIPDGAALTGAGKGVTIIKMREGSNKTVVSTRNFSSLRGTQKLNEATSDFTIRDLTIDGNYLAKNWNAPDNRVLNRDGDCLSVFGYRYDVDVETKNCPQHMFYGEGQGNRSGIAVDSNVRLTGQVAGEECVVFRGPADILIERAVVGVCGILPKPAQLTQRPRSRLYPERSGVDGIVVEKGNGTIYEGTVEFGFVHVYGAFHGFGFRSLGNPRIKATHLIAESNLGGIDISPDTWGAITLADVHSNGKRVPGGAFDGLPPGEGIHLQSRHGFSIDHAMIFRTVDSAEGWPALRISGNGAIVNAVIRNSNNPKTGRYFSGDGVVLDGDANMVTVNTGPVNGRPITGFGRKNDVKLMQP